LYRNEGEAFRNVSAECGIGPPTLKPLGFGAKFLDADNDGWLDLIFANGHVYDRSGEIDPATPYREPMQFFLNTRDGRFRDLSAGAGEALRRPIVGRGLAIGDYDNDGRTDVVVVDYEGKPLLLHNETSGAGHFASLQLEQPGPNRFALGARVWASV